MRLNTTPLKGVPFRLLMFPANCEKLDDEVNSPNSETPVIFPEAWSTDTDTSRSSKEG